MSTGREQDLTEFVDLRARIMVLETRVVHLECVLLVFKEHNINLGRCFLCGTTDLNNHEQLCPFHWGDMPLPLGQLEGKERNEHTHSASN